MTTPPPIERFDPDHGWVPAQPRVLTPRPGGFFSRFPVTTVLGLLITAMFALESVLGGTTDPAALVRLGSVRHDLIYDHLELYRLFCATFLHAGPVHIILNGLAFVQLSALTEHVYGSARLVVVYLLSALGGTICSATFMYMPSVGASGAILGLAGLLLGTSWYGKDPVRAEFRELFGKRLLYGVLLTFALGLGLYLFWIPIIDNSGHLGGLLTGLAFALFVRDPLRPTGPVMKALAALLALLAVASLAWMAFDGSRAASSVEEDTLAIYERIVRDDPTSSLATSVLPELTQIYMERGHDARAIETLEAWVDAAPQDPTALNALAWQLLTQADPDPADAPRAADLATRAVGLWKEQAASGDLNAKLNLAATLDTLALAQLRAQQFDAFQTTHDQLTQLLDELLDLTPSEVHPNLEEWYVLAAWRARDPQSLLDHAARWSTLDPSNARALAAQSRALLLLPDNTAQHDRALNLAQRALERLPYEDTTRLDRQARVEVLDTLAAALDANGETTRAATVQAEALATFDLDPAHPSLTRPEIATVGPKAP